MDEEYVEAVLLVVEGVPPGRATTYGAVAEVVGTRLGRGGPRQVGRVLAVHGGGVPWWRVVTATGRLPPGQAVEAARRLSAEGCPLLGAGAARRADLRRAGWWPPSAPQPS